MSEEKVYKDVTEFTIIRDEWYRGQRHGALLLRRGDNKKCCLGFYCLAMGFESSDILEQADPENVSAWSEQKIKSFLLSDWEGRTNNSDVCVTLMVLNDNPLISEEIREEEVFKIFKENGVTVHFK